MIGYYDRDSQPIDCDGWLSLMGKDDYKRVAIDEIGDVSVSTIWLGLNHRFSGSGPPLIFETLIVGGQQDGWVWRYCTEVEALAGHWMIVAEIGEKKT